LLLHRNDKRIGVVHRHGEPRSRRLCRCLWDGDSTAADAWRCRDV